MAVEEDHDLSDLHPLLPGIGDLFPALGPMPSTDSKSAGLSLIIPNTLAPKCSTSFFARTGPTPFTKPPPRYRSTPSLVVGGVAFRT
jgi:hypothetical protein